jgi:CheY-like chemotaxis protein
MNHLSPISPLQVLLVNGNAADVEQTRDALKQGKLLMNLMVATSASDALRRLYSSHPPALMLLDLELAGGSATRLLETMESDPALKRIPVICLAKKSLPQTASARCVIQKPVTAEGLLAIICTIDIFWLRIVTCPNGST